MLLKSVEPETISTDTRQSCVHSNYILISVINLSAIENVLFHFITFMPMIKRKGAQTQNECIVYLQQSIKLHNSSRSCQQLGNTKYLRRNKIEFRAEIQQRTSPMDGLDRKHLFTQHHSRGAHAHAVPELRQFSRNKTILQDR